MILNGHHAVSYIRSHNYENFPKTRSVAHHIKPASLQDDHGQTNPSKYADGDEPRT